MSKEGDAYANYLAWLNSIGMLDQACDPIQYEKVNGSISSTPNNTDAILRNNNAKKDRNK
jgi:hypothetical protein